MGSTTTDAHFVRTDGVTARTGEHALVWPLLGHPALLDPAAETLLDCFAEPVSSAELAADLHEATGLDVTTSRRVTGEFVAKMLASGHLVPAGQTGRYAAATLMYPPFATL